jgi:hypothetical protein
MTAHVHVHLEPATADHSVVEGVSKVAKPLELPEYLRDMEVMKSLERMARPDRMEDDSEGSGPEDPSRCR